MGISTEYEWALKLKPNRISSFTVQGGKIKIKLTDKTFLPHPDSLLLANSIKIKNGETAIDLGLGSGILAISAAKLGASKVYGTDLNRKAVENSKENSVINKIAQKCNFKYGSWFNPFQNKKFDVIIFNPPQIPGKGNEEQYFRKATEASNDGTEPTISILNQSKNHLNSNGRIYFVLKEWMDWKKVISEIKKTYSFKVLGYTYSKVWSHDKNRLKSIENLVQAKKARYVLLKNNKYYKIYACECRIKRQ